MKIKSVSCTQFAGVRDRAISFEEGINVVYGKNESGKSTLVNLISRTLFQNARIGQKLNSDKEFQNLYFPGVRKNTSERGDFVDGKITVETEKGTYTLLKEWGEDSRCELSTPDGEKIRDSKRINGILKDALIYGEGVYSDMLFSSQYNTDISLQTILDVSKKTDAKREIVDVVSQAFVESNGISLDAIEQAIKTKIDKIQGKHWIFEREMPEPIRKLGQERCSKECGEVLKAYYDLKDAEKILKKISDLEEEVDTTSDKYMENDAVFREAEAVYDRFNKFSTALVLRSDRKENIRLLSEKQEKITKVFSSWPIIDKELEKAEKLKSEKDNRELLDKYEVARKIVAEINCLKGDIESLQCPSDSEIKQAKEAQRQMENLENKLCGMNLKAVIKIFGDHAIEIKSLRTGEALDITNENISITEAVNITVPNVMEMQLSPVDVDVKKIEEKIGEQKETLNSIFEKYNVYTIIELEQLAEKINNTKVKIGDANNRLSMLLGNVDTFEELEAKAIAVTITVRGKEDIEQEIMELCDDSDIESYVISKKTLIDSYCKEHGSISQLEHRIKELKDQLEEAEKPVEGVENIPDEFCNIVNPEEHGNLLKQDLKEKRGNREGALTEKITAVSNLETYKERIPGDYDPIEGMEKAKRNFEEKKRLLAHWKHIEEVFEKQKENIHDNPMQDIADRFTDYLGMITSGRVSSEFPESDKLNMNIYSGNHLLDYGKLSEGTKDTVSLAFRLAVLDHLFPDGGGVIIFDDPFTDMDAERTAQSCELIKECAARHQVIFLTCKKDYLDRLDGNRIFIEN